MKPTLHTMPHSEHVLCGTCSPTPLSAMVPGEAEEICQADGEQTAHGASQHQQTTTNAVADDGRTRTLRAIS